MDLLPSREGMDYRRARLRAFFSGILAAVSGHPRQLLAFEQVREKLHLGGPVYRGVKTVPLAKVVGSVDRYRDFDRAFMPTQSHTEDRWRRVNRAWYQDLSLPPVVLYQVGDVYFVVDGHHRVSVARDKGQEFLDAEVREVRARVPLTPDARPEDLERLEAKIEFLERTQIDRLLPEVDIAPTILGGYDRLIEHLAVHRYFLGLELQREVSTEEAIRRWYETLYRPVVDVVRDSGILEDFTDRTETDLYLWVMDHLHYLRSDPDRKTTDAAQAAEDFLRLLEGD
ncbi:MAG TPA: hypothetical protein VGA32_02825 [Anaerolineales bacterium]